MKKKIENVINTVICLALCLLVAYYAPAFYIGTTIIAAAIILN